MVTDALLMVAPWRCGRAAELIHHSVQGGPAHPRGLQVVAHTGRHYLQHESPRRLLGYSAMARRCYVVPRLSQLRADGSGYPPVRQLTLVSKGTAALRPCECRRRAAYVPVRRCVRLQLKHSACPAGITVMHSCNLLRRFALADYPYHAMCVRPHQDGDRHAAPSQAQRIQARFQRRQRPVLCTAGIRSDHGTSDSRARSVRSG